MMKGKYLITRLCIVITFALFFTGFNYKSINAQVPCIVEIGETHIDLNSNFDGQELYEMDKKEIRLLINAMYAKSGYIFKKEKYASFFSQYEWYVPKYHNAEPYISKEDKQKIAILLKAEKDKTTYVVYEEEFPLSNGESYIVELTLTNPLHDSIKYTNICLYKIESDTKELVLNVNEEGYKIDGVLHESGNYFELVDKDGVGFPELYFMEHPYGSEFPNQLILKYMNDGYNVVFRDNIDKIEYINFKEKTLIYGATISGGQVSYDEGFYTVYELKDGKYQSSYLLTLECESKGLQQLKKELRDCPSIENLNNLIHRYAYLGLEEECDQLKQQYSQIVKEYKSMDISPYEEGPEGIGFYIDVYIDMAPYYAERWQYLKESSTIE